MFTVKQKILTKKTGSKNMRAIKSKMLLDDNKLARKKNPINHVNQPVKNTNLWHFGTFLTRDLDLSCPHSTAWDTMGIATLRNNALDEAS